MICGAPRSVFLILAGHGFMVNCHNAYCAAFAPKPASQIRRFSSAYATQQGMGACARSRKGADAMFLNSRKRGGANCPQALQGNVQVSRRQCNQTHCQVNAWLPSKGSTAFAVGSQILTEAALQQFVTLLGRLCSQNKQSASQQHKAKEGLSCAQATFGR